MLISCSDEVSATQIFQQRTLQKYASSLKTRESSLYTEYEFNTLVFLYSNSNIKDREKMKPLVSHVSIAVSDQPQKME